MQSVEKWNEEMLYETIEIVIVTVIERSQLKLEDLFNLEFFIEELEKWRKLEISLKAKSIPLKQH